MAKVSKIALTIKSRITPEGGIIPYELSYNDEKFEIKDPVKSMKLFDGAVRWRCSIDGRKIEMFNIDESWWMVKE